MRVCADLVDHALKLCVEDARLGTYPGPMGEYVVALFHLKVRVQVRVKVRIRVRVGVGVGVGVMVRFRVSP